MDAFCAVLCASIAIAIASVCTHPDRQTAAGTNQSADRVVAECMCARVVNPLVIIGLFALYHSSMLPHNLPLLSIHVLI